MRVRGYSSGTPCFAELSTGDLDASVAFYEALFGWSVRSVDTGRVEFVHRDLVVAVAAAAAEGERPAGWVVHVATDDVAATAEAVVAAGGEVLRPPAPVGERGRVAVFRDPQQAVFAAWRRGTFAGAQIGSEPSTVSWAEVVVRDPEQADAFYGKVFGWRMRPGELITAYDYREWELLGRVVAGLVPMTDATHPPHARGHWRISIEVEDCAATARRCAELGGTVAAGPLDVGIGQYAYLRDPHGAGFGVIELLPELRQPY